MSIPNYHAMPKPKNNVWDWANRSAKIDGQRRKKNTRPGLFEKRDGAKAELIEK
jgi:hypothetical protein